MKTFSGGAAIKFGWETFKKRALFFVGITVLIGVISWVIGAVVGAIASDGTSTLLGLISFVLNLGLSTLLNMGVIAYALKAHDSPEKVEVIDLWHPQQFWYYLGATVLLFLCVFVGIVLLIIPGIIVALMLMFTPYIVVDRNFGPIQAIKESKRITDGSKWQLLVFAIALFGLNLLGAIAILVGLLVTIPVSMIAIAHAYRQLEHKAGELVSSFASA